MVKRFIFIILLIASTVSAANFSHIDTMDWLAGRYGPNAGITAANWTWLLARIDGTEPEIYRSDFIHVRNPNAKKVLYRIEHSQFQTANSWDPMSAAGAWGEAPDESYYLHFSENTTLSHSDGSTSDITGCPSPNPVTSSCRMRILMWDTYRYVYNIASSGWRSWQADRLVRVMNGEGISAGTYNGAWFDEHLPGFNLQLYLTATWTQHSTITSGGGIREYGGLRPTASNLPGQWYNQLDYNYQQDMVSWHIYLKGYMEANGKKHYGVNPASYAYWPLYQSINRSVGTTYEGLHVPQNWGTTDSGEQDFSYYLQMIQASSDNGVVSVLGTPIGYSMPSGYTAGNYSSTRARWNMWRVAAYYLVRPTTPGLVYYDTFIDVTDPSWQTYWLPAYEYNVGTPVGNYSKYSTHVWQRTYTNAKIYVRPRDTTSSNTWGDTTIETITTPSTRRLNDDGTLSAPGTSWSIRNGEALILTDNVPISTPPPTLLTPIDNSTPAWPVIFTWTAVDNAVLYQLQVDDSSGFGSPEIDDSSIDPDTACDDTDCHYIVEYGEELLPSRHYYWRVRALR